MIGASRIWQSAVAALVSVAMVSACTFAAPPAADSDIDRYLAWRMDLMGAPGMAAGIIDADGPVWEGYYGTLDGTRPVSQDSLFMVASVSKLIIATAVMQLWEKGALTLDDDINDHLSFKVRNPSHPDVPITVRHLMVHRSGIADTAVHDDLYTIGDGGGDSPWALGDFLEAYLVPGGELYSDRGYHGDPPGVRFEYTNTGTALLAFLVERVSGENYAAYCRRRIFRPLGMEHSYLMLDDIPESEDEIVTCYARGEALPHYSSPDYPSRSLRTTIGDLARLAAFYLDPEGSTVPILKQETVALMWGQCDASHGAALDQMALIWEHLGWMVPGAIGHTGSDLGVTASLLLYPDKGRGTIILMNAELEDNVESSLHVRLHEEATRLIRDR